LSYDWDSDCSSDCSSDRHLDCYSDCYSDYYSDCYSHTHLDRYSDCYSDSDWAYDDSPRTLNHFAPSASASLTRLAKRILEEAREAQGKSGGGKIETVLDYLSQPVIIHLHSPIKGPEWFHM
jgi:hypothetical protein